MIRVTSLLTSACFVVTRGRNILAIFARETRPPKVWTSFRIHPGLKCDADLTSIPVSPNPFDVLGLSPVQRDLYVILAVISSSNSTLKGARGRILSVLQPFQGLSLYSERMYHESLAYTGYSGYRYLSCWSRSGITFEFYLTPFEPEIWWAVLATGILLTAILVIYLSTKLSTYGGTFSLWMYVLAILLDNSVSLPGLLEQRMEYRTIFGVWLLACVLLVNCYTGIMITGLNSPLPVKTLETLI